MPNSFPNDNLENILDFEKKLTGNPSQLQEYCQFISGYTL